MIFSYQDMDTDMGKIRKVTISLPEEMLSAADQQGRRELRSRSELFREALRHYLARVPVDDATADEIAAINRGRAEIARGDFINLDELVHDLGPHHRKKRPQSARTPAE